MLHNVKMINKYCTTTNRTTTTTTIQIIIHKTRWDTASRGSSTTSTTTTTTTGQRCQTITRAIWTWKSIVRGRPTTNNKRSRFSRCNTSNYFFWPISTSSYDKQVMMIRSTLLFRPLHIPISPLSLSVLPTSQAIPQTRDDTVEQHAFFHYSPWQSWIEAAQTQLHYAPRIRLDR